MYIITPLLTVLGASSALASGVVTNPHTKASNIKRRGPGPVDYKAAAQNRASSAEPSYLTSKTERECPNSELISDVYDLRVTRVRRQWDRLAPGGL